MTKAQLMSFEQQLRALASRLRGEVTSLRDEAFSAQSNVADMPSEQVDLASVQSEEDRVRTLLGNEQSMLQEVDAALERIENGTYGRCGGCGRLIAQERLESVPFARLCVKCAIMTEQPVET